MTRRVDRGMLALLPPLLAYMAFGVARVDAPVGLIGLLFDEPLAFALTSTVIAIGGSVLLFVPAIERRLAGVLVPSREADVRERARIEAALARVGARADMDTRRLIVQVQDTEDLNAAAGAAHLLYVTRGALARLDDEFEALIAHELAHHRGLHPIGAAVILWLSLPGEALAAVFRALSRLVERVAGRVRLLAVIAQVLLLAWQVLVMWLYYVGQLLGAWASRVGEFAADRGAAGWGYGDDLVALYRTFDDEPPSSLLDRLEASHPPTPARIARLEALEHHVVTATPGGRRVRSG